MCRLRYWEIKDITMRATVCKLQGEASCVGWEREWNAKNEAVLIVWHRPIVWCTTIERILLLLYSNGCYHSLLLKDTRLYHAWNFIAVSAYGDPELGSVFTTFVCLWFFFRFHHKMNRTTTITKKTAMTIPAIPPLDVLDFFLEDLEFPRAREANCRKGKTR